MSERVFRQLAGIAAAIIALAAACALKPNPTFALGIAAGGCWSLANLWCLAKVLKAWLGVRSRRRAITWLLIKLAILYPLAIALLSANPRLSPGFGLGFSVALIVVIAGFAWNARPAGTLSPHGR
jgi:hypothetical protein